MKNFLLLLLILCTGCETKPKTAPVHISLINNNHSVKFIGLDYAIISEINRDSLQAAWQGLIPVYKMPIDTDLKNYQLPQPGKYQLKDSAVVFTPDTAFVKTNTYFLRYYKYEKDNDVWRFIKNQKKLGRTAYIDLIFN